MRFRYESIFGRMLLQPSSLRHIIRIGTRPSLLADNKNQPHQRENKRTDQSLGSGVTREGQNNIDDINRSIRPRAMKFSSSDEELSSELERAQQHFATITTTEANHNFGNSHSLTKKQKWRKGGWKDSIDIRKRSRTPIATRENLPYV